MAKVKIDRGLQQNYNAIPEKDGDKIYVCTDSGNIYVGDTLVFEPNAYIDASINDKIVTFTTHGTHGTNGTDTLDLSMFQTGSEVAQAIAAALASIPEYTIERLAVAETGYSSSYILKKGNSQVGATINIPKDMVVSNGEVKTVTTANVPYQGAQVGDKYIDLTIANTSQNHIYIPVKDLVDVYVAGNGINISSNNYISVIVDQNNSNGLGVGGSGVSMYVVSPSINGVGGSNGAMLATDKEKLDGIEAGAEENVIETVKVSGTALQVTDKAVNIETETAYDPTTNKIATMSDVAGATPNVGHLKTDNTTAQTPSASESFTGNISLHKVSKTGSYNDLNDQPTIPSSGDFVTSLGTSGNNVTWTKGGATNNLTVPYAQKAEKDGNGNVITSRYVHYGDVLMPTNPFGGKGVYINSIDNAFHAANRKYWVRITTHLKEVNGVTYPYIDSSKNITDDDYFVDSPVVSTLDNSSLFNGSYEDGPQCPFNHYMKVHIQFAPFTNDWTPSGTTAYWSGYPYGTYYLSYYYTGVPSQVSQARVYNKYSAHTVGWHLKTATSFTGALPNANYIEQIVDEADYQRSCVEFIIFGLDSGSYKTTLTEIDYKLSRPNLSSNGSTVTKYGNQSLYYDFEWFKHNDDSLQEKTVSISSSNGFITANKFIKSGGTSSQFLKADGSVDSNTYATTSQLPSLPLSIANGGTGQTTGNGAANVLIGALPQWTIDPTDDTYLIRRDTAGTQSFGQVKFSTVWNYIKSKIASILGIGGSNGVPTAPTAAAGTNTTQIATTAFVNAATSGTAIDANVVHKTGDETIDGAKTFVQGVIVGESGVIDFLPTENANNEITISNSTHDTNPQQSGGTTYIGVLQFDDADTGGYVRLRGVESPALGHDAVNKDYLESAIAVYINGQVGSGGVAQGNLFAFGFTDDPTEMQITQFVRGLPNQPNITLLPVTDYLFPIGCNIYLCPNFELLTPYSDVEEVMVYSSYQKVSLGNNAIYRGAVPLGTGEYSAVYLRVNIVDGKYWRPYSEVGETIEIIVSSNALVSGNFYIYLGRSVGSSEADPIFQLEDNNPLFYYDGTDLIEWSSYYSNSDLSDVVHKSGAETITGEKTFSANVNLDNNATLNFITDDETPDGVYVEASETSGNMELVFSSISSDSPVVLGNIHYPINDLDATNKHYVDEAIENIEGTKVFLNVHTGNYGIHPKSFAAFYTPDEGKTMNITSFTTTGGNGSKEPVVDLNFPIGSKIYYYDGTTAMPSDFGITMKFYTSHKSVDARYSAIDGTNLNLGNHPTNTQSTVYLRVKVSNGYWTPFYKEGETSEIIVSSNQIKAGGFYIYLGKTTGGSSSTNIIQLEDNNPLYYFDGTSLIDWASYIAEDSVAGTVQSITVGTTTTGEPGTNANVVNSGTPTNQILDFTIPRGADAVNPFKGWFASDTQLMAEYPNPSNGDYAYVQTSNGALVYVASGGAWRGTTIVFNPSNNQEFASGESLNLVSIINDLVTGGASNVLSAQQGVVLNTLISNLQTLVNNLSQQMPVLEKKTAQEIQILIDTGTWEEGVMYYSVEED